MKILIYLLLLLETGLCGSIVAVVGTGYVGLVSGAGLAKLGNTVICADVDEQKISLLKNNVIPFYEPGLSELVAEGVESGLLSFTTDVSLAIRQADVVIIAVGTPMQDSGEADLSYVKAVIELISQNYNAFKVVCTKSTVPIGTGKWIKGLLREKGITDVAIASNPEFLREGNAIKDFLCSDRIVLGVEDSRALDVLSAMYKPMIDVQVPLVVTNVVTAESIKYAANAFLATKISYINEIANLCDATGADIETLAYAIGLDQRISPHFLKPGPGFGGSCFPKDCQALICTAHKFGIPLVVAQAALTVNVTQKNKPIEKLLQLLNGDIAGKTIAVLGLAFKAETDDIRYSPALDTLQALTNAGACIRVYDPAAMDNMRKQFPNVLYCADGYEALEGADAVIVMTEWAEFKKLDWVRVKKIMKQPVIVDARNLLNLSEVKNAGFKYSGMGRAIN